MSEELQYPQIEAALQTMRENIDQTWTVAALARAANMSRTVFAERFKQATGWSPLEYLTLLRMQRARDLLRDPRTQLVTIAIAVGYASHGAFHRAFRRTTGFTPGEFRQMASDVRESRTAAAGYKSVSTNSPTWLLSWSPTRR
ncbi:MAG: helix-turn-helix transcriptional regulator [Acidobacteriota bacterium]